MEEEPTNSAAQPVWTGTDHVEDTADSYPEVVALTPKDGNVPFCTGTLISPYWVLFASHCVIPPLGVGPTANIDAVFGYDPSTVDSKSPLRFHHTNAISGNLLTRLTGSFHLNLIFDTARDVALVRLDTRVPATVAVPRHISLIPGVCPFSTFEATAVGFGFTWVDNRCPAILPKRRYSHHDGWNFIATFDGGYYDKLFAETAFCTQYSGSANGDSGGPLIDNAGHLCGVFSTFGPPAFATNDYAAVDEPNTLAWILDANTTGTEFGKTFERRLIAEDGNNFEGECTGPDMDGDTVPDKCDVCPRVYDPFQRVDPVTGRGVACDLCPGTPTANYDPQKNRNLEAELGNQYPGQSSLPVIGVDYPGRDTEIVLLPLRIRPDACDATIVPSTWREDSNAPLPDSELPAVVPCTFPANPGCNCPPLGECHWDVSSNVIVTRPLQSDGGPGFPSKTTFGLRFCECLDQDTTTIAGRVACQSTCPTNHIQSPGLYQQGTPWYPMSMEGFKKGQSGPWVAKTLGQEYAATVDGNSVRHKWDFLDLRQNNLGEEEFDADGKLTQYAVTGILWASTRQVQGDPNPSHTADFAHTYLSGDADATYVVGGSGSKPAPPTWLISKYCPSCPAHATRLEAVVDDPRMFWATTEGIAPELGPATRDLRDLYADVATGQLHYIEAGEPLQRLAELNLPGHSMLRGVALDSTISVAKMFTSRSLDGLPDVELRQPRVGTPEIRGNEGFVLSALNRRVYVFGGTTSGAADGVPSDLGWSLNIDINQWTSYPLGPAERPASVIGATYRFNDDRVYEIDFDSSEMRMRSWRPAEDFETRATFPPSWHGYDQGWLVAGPNGDLVFAESRATGQAGHTRLGRFTVDGQRRLQFAGMTTVQESLVGPPIVGVSEVSLVVADPSGGRLVVVPFSGFHPAAAGQAPWTED